MQPIPGSLWKCLNHFTSAYDEPRLKAPGRYFLIQSQLFMVIGQVREQKTYRDFVFIYAYALKKNEKYFEYQPVQPAFLWVPRAIFNNDTKSFTELVPSPPETQD